MEIQLIQNIEKGKGTWKFNTSLLKDPTYSTKINHIINEVKINSEELNINEKWDLLLTTIQTYTMYYSKEKAIIKNTFKTKLQNQLLRFDEKPANQITHAEKIEIENLQKQLNKIEIEEINGYMIRTKIPNFEKAEPNIKFYADIEKKQGNKNIISSLKDKEGNVKSNTKEILQVATNFYSELYKRRSK